VSYLVSVLLFVAACCLPALEFRSVETGAPDVMFGARALVVGWSGIFAAVMGWYANPFWLVGVIFAAFKKPMFSAMAGIIALAISCSVFFDLGRELPADEGNVTHTRIARVLPVCYVWMASMAALPLLALVRKTK